MGETRINLPTLSHLDCLGMDIIAVMWLSVFCRTTAGDSSNHKKKKTKKIDFTD